MTPVSCTTKAAAFATKRHCRHRGWSWCKIQHCVGHGTVPLLLNNMTRLSHCNL